MTYKPLKNPADAFLIHLNEDWEIVYWCKKMDCTREEIFEAVKEVGNSPDQVRAYFLRRQRRVRF
jgi:hypothetical protein